MSFETSHAAIIEARARMGMPMAKPSLVKLPQHLRDSSRVATVERKVEELERKLSIIVADATESVKAAMTEIEAKLASRRALEYVGPLAWKGIVLQVAEDHQLSFAELVGRRRNAHVVEARHEAFYRLSRETLMSLPQIGRKMGGKDHTTVLNGIRRHEQRMKADSGNLS